MGYFKFLGLPMNLRRITLAILLTGATGEAAMAQMPANPGTEKMTDSPAAMQEQFADSKTAALEKNSPRAEAYSNLTIGPIHDHKAKTSSTPVNTAKHSRTAKKR